jgi:NADH-quinone oxidoreductase subunit J
MQDALFYIFAALVLGAASLVVVNPFSRNPVTSALCLVLALGGIAGLFVLLGAYFLAAVQVLIYAGAVMVLFLFVIMVLDWKAEAQWRLKWTRFGAGALAVTGLTALLLRAVLTADLGPGSPGPLEGDPSPVGRALFTQYLLPFELVAVLILVAVVGVVVLSKKDLP